MRQALTATDPCTLMLNLDGSAGLRALSKPCERQLRPSRSSLIGVGIFAIGVVLANAVLADLYLSMLPHIALHV